MSHAWERGEILAKFLLENLQKHLEIRDIQDNNNKTPKRNSESVNWINLTQDRGQWHVLANIVTNLWVLQKAGIFFTS
jgi:hypothetical protein